MEREETEEKESVRKTEKERHEMKYKVGDKVRVRSDLKERMGYGCQRFTDAMKKQMGKIVTISNVVDDRYYYIKEDNYNWTDEMLEPVKLLEQLIQTFTDPGDVVIDPCFGSGSTLRAARNLGRSAFGFEIDRNFYNRAKNEMLAVEDEVQMSIENFIGGAEC